MVPLLTKSVCIANKTISFQLHTRMLDLGAAGKARYYWMDTRKFRKSKAANVNFTACLDYWWAGIEAEDALDKDENQINLVLAEIYRVVRGKQTLQNTYLDAFPHSSADREPTNSNDYRDNQHDSRHTYVLPDDEEARIKELVARRLIEPIKAELDRLFLMAQPLPEDQAWLDQEYNSIVNTAQLALQADGRRGLQTHIQKVITPWIQKRRKRVIPERERRFLNLFSYECKVAYYTAYASAWMGLLPILKAEEALDPLSERLMRFWHHQNQPSQEEESTKPLDRWIFCGQVFALHPLSSFVLYEARHYLVLGALLGRPDYEALWANGQMATCSAYWDVVAMILIAGNEYKHARELGEARRGSKTTNNGDDSDYVDEDLTRR